MKRLNWVIFFMMLFGVREMPAYMGPKYEVQFRKQYDAIGQKAGKKHGLRLLTSGFEDLLDEQKVTFVLNYMSREKMTQAEAGAFTLNLVQEIWQLLKDDRYYLNYIHTIAPMNIYNEEDLIPPRIEHVGIKLTFWDEEMNRMKPPHVAQVQVSGGKIRYYYSDENEFLGEPKRENLGL